MIYSPRSTVIRMPCSKLIKFPPQLVPSEAYLHLPKEHIAEHVPAATLKVHNHAFVNIGLSQFRTVNYIPARMLLCKSASTTKVPFFVGGCYIRETWAHLASSLKSTEKYWLQSPYHSYVRIETYIKHEVDLMLHSDTHCNFEGKIF